MGKEFDSFVSQVRENQEQGELATEQARMNDALNEHGVKYSIEGNDSMDLFTISLSQIVGTKQAKIEISGPVNFIGPVNDYIAQLISGETDATINPEEFHRFGVDPDYYIPDYEAAVQEAVSQL